MKSQGVIYTNKEKGITLVALVVTIIILVILAGVSVNMVIGNNGIMQKAKKAKENIELASAEEQVDLNKIVDYIENNIKEPEESEEPEVTPTTTIAELKGGSYVSKLTVAKDSNDNIVRIPKGFKVASDSGINVTEGIVIEDGDVKAGKGNNRGNQYVWIPVGNGIKKSDKTQINITLGRYNFADGANDKDENETVLAAGTPILKQNAKEYTKKVDIDTFFSELTTSRNGSVTGKENATALNLQGFVDSVKANGGYYIARYEASYGTDGKANSKVSDAATWAAPTEEGVLWNDVSQIAAKEASVNLYSTVTSDLMNSYAWDTAIVYIQNFSGATEYSRQSSSNTGSPTNTGTNGDEKCKINDMSSNMMEWTTEYSNNVNEEENLAFPCTYVGGSMWTADYYTCRRNNINTEFVDHGISFRTILYI